jgi:O-antigen ligase
MKEKVYNKIILIGIAVILIATPIGRGTVKTWATLPVIPIAFLVFVWLWRVNNEGLGFKKTQLDKPMLLFAVLGVISFAFSIYKHDSFYALLRLFGYIGLYYVVVNNYSRDMRRYLTGIAIFMGVGLSVYGLSQYFGMLSHQWWAHDGFLSSTYVNHNHFAGYLELVIPVALGTALRYRRSGPIRRLPLLIALVAMITAFMFTQSRGAWICLTTSLILMNLVSIRNKMLSKKSFFVLLLFMAVIFSFMYLEKGALSDRLDTIIGMRAEEASLHTRMEVWKASLEMIGDNLWTGAGIGTYYWAFPPYRSEVFYILQIAHAHNDYLQMAAEMGIGALLLMIWALALLLKRGFSNAGGHPVLLGCAAGILSLSLHGLVDFNFHIPANMILFTVYAGFIMAEEGR